MYDFLLTTKKFVEEYALKDQALSLSDIKKIESKYYSIINAGLAYHEQLEALPKSKRGKQKQRPGKNFLNRLGKYRSAALAFVYDSEIPFTNNLAERDIRITKIKQKVSGCFRTFHGGEIFFRILSYISTSQKQGWNILDALSDAIRGTPRLLPVNQ